MLPENVTIWSPVFDEMDDIVLLINENNVIEDINKYGLDILKANKKNIVGSKCFEVIKNSPELCDIKLFYSKKSFNKIIKIQEGYYKINTISIVKNKKNKNKYIVILKNETKHEIDRATIENSSNYLESIFKAAPTGIGVIVNRLFQYVNKKFCEITGYNQEELIGKSTQILYHSNKEFEKVGSLLYNDIKKFGASSIETKWKRKNGKIIDILLNSALINKDDPSQGITLTVLNISNLISTEKALMRSEQKYRKIIEAANDAIFIADTDTGKIIDTNKKASILLGIPINKIIGMQQSEIHALHLREIIKEGLKNGTLYKQNGMMSESFIQNANGELIPVEISSNMIKSKDGKKMIVGIYRDISDRKKAEEEINNYNEEITTQNEGLRFINEELVKAKNKAEESTKLKSAFLANMSHEIRTPMNGIIGFSSLLNKPGINDDKREDYIKIIRSSCNDLLRIVDDILDISIIESGLVEIVESKFCLHSILNDIKSIYQEKINGLEKPIEINIITELDNDNCFITTDEKRLKQIINNLVENAIKFTDQGRIDIGYHFYNSNLQIYVRDSGIGIPKKNHKLIFERFRQSEDSNIRKFGGNGLGLAICKGFIERLNGKVWVESEPGKGSTFFIDFPIKKSTKPKITNTLELNEKEYKWKNKSILLVEDDMVSVEFFEALIETTQAKLICAKSGTEAINLLNKHKTFDCVLMDIRLPDINGFDVTIEFKKINKNIPVIAQTAFAMADDKTRCKIVGCNDYISKPIDRDELLEKIDKILF